MNKWWPIGIVHTQQDATNVLERLRAEYPHERIDQTTGQEQDSISIYVTRDERDPALFDKMRKRKHSLVRTTMIRCMVSEDKANRILNHLREMWPHVELSVREAPTNPVQPKRYSILVTADDVRSVSQLMCDESYRAFPGD